MMPASVKHVRARTCQTSVSGCIRRVTKANGADGDIGDILNPRPRERCESYSMFDPTWRTVITVSLKSNPSQKLKQRNRRGHIGSHTRVAEMKQGIQSRTKPRKGKGHQRYFVYNSGLCGVARRGVCNACLTSRIQQESINEALLVWYAQSRRQIIPNLVV